MSVYSIIDQAFAVPFGEGGAAQWGEGDSVGTLNRRVRLCVPLLLRRRDILSSETAEASASPRREGDLSD